MEMKKAKKTRGALLGIVFALAMVAALIPQLAEPAYAADPVYDITFYHSDWLYGEGEVGHLKGSSTDWEHPTWGNDAWAGSARLRAKAYYEAGNDYFTLKVAVNRLNGAHQPDGNYVSGTVKYNGHTITFKNWGPFGCGDWADIRFERTAITFNYNGGRNYNQNTDNITVDHYWYNGNNFSIVDTYNGENVDIENQPWWEAYPPVSSNTIFGGWWTEPTGGTRITTEDITKLSGTMTLYAHWEPYHLVQLVGGSNVTPSRGIIDSYGHHDTEVVQGSAMEPVIFTAKEGYHFDHNQIAWNVSGGGFDEYTDNGVTVERISDTHYVASGTPTGQVYIFIPNGHKYEDWTTTTAATCTTAGEKERVCSKDSTIKETATIPIDSNAHSYEFKDFTWTGSDAEGYTAAKANYVCEHDASHTTSVDATISDEVTDPTCTESGKTTYTATVAAADSPDGEKHEESKDAKATEATKHKWKFEGFTWTGDETNGYTAAKANYVCEHDASHTESVDATIGEPVVTEPTCEGAGKTTYTATVEATDSIDGEKHTESMDAKPTEAKNHKWKFTEITWTGNDTDGYTAAVAHYVCENDATHTNTADATITDEVTDPTCTDSGKTTYTATVAAEDSIDGREHTESKDAKPTDPIQHSWGEPTYTWSDDNSSVTAKRVCANDTTHVETETVDATSEVTRKATCMEKGEMTYTSASFDNEAFTVQIKKEDIAIDPNAHKYGDWIKIDDKQHQRVCEHDATHVEKSNHSWDAGKVTKAATEKAEGIKTYTCTVCGETKTEAIPKLDPKPEPTPTPTPTPNPTPDKQYGRDGTPVGPGASDKAAEKAITKTTSDKDIKGAKFAPLKLRSTSQGKTNIKLTWTKNKNAVKYVVYGNRCNASGKKYKPVKLATVKGNTYNVKKIKTAKVKKGTYYKFVIVALNKNNKVVSTSKTIHVATKGGKVGNHKSVTVKAKVGGKTKAISSVSIKKGKSLKLSATLNPVSKKTPVKKHVGLRYETTNAKIATVSGGKIIGKGKGTCYIFAYAQNGVAKAIKVTVK